MAFTFIFYAFLIQIFLKASSMACLSLSVIAFISLSTKPIIGCDWQQPRITQGCLTDWQVYFFSSLA